MYDLQIVRKRRRRKIAALVALFCAIGVSSLVITSFLGRTTGTFTVAVKNSSVKLALSKTEDFAEATSYLRIDKLLPLRESSYVDLPPDDELDNEEVPYDYGTVYDAKNNPDSLTFIKYTFYIRNMGTSIAKYNLAINLSDREKAIDGTGRTLDDTLRVMVYENDPSVENSHKRDVYAKEAASFNYNKAGDKVRNEFISTYPSGSNQEDDSHELAKLFEPGTTIVNYPVGNFKKGDIKRYTLVIWLEGEDPQSNGVDEEPEGASLKLGVDIDAHENQQ